MQSLGERWRHVFLHHIFLDENSLGFFIHTRIMVIFLCTFSFSLSFNFLTLFFLCYTLFIMLWLGCRLINLFTTPQGDNCFDFPHLWRFSLLSLHIMDTLGILMRLRRKLSFLLHCVEVGKPWDCVLDIVYLLRQIILHPIHPFVQCTLHIVNSLIQLSIDVLLISHKVSQNLAKVHNSLFKIRGLLRYLSRLCVLGWLWFPREIWMVPLIWIVGVVMRLMVA